MGIGSWGKIRHELENNVKRDIKEVGLVDLD
jgi:hypothetical protein